MRVRHRCGLRGKTRGRQRQSMQSTWAFFRYYRWSGCNVFAEEYVKLKSQKVDLDERTSSVRSPRKNPREAVPEYAKYLGAFSWFSVARLQRFCRGGHQNAAKAPSGRSHKVDLDERNLSVLPPAAMSTIRNFASSSDAVWGLG